MVGKKYFSMLAGATFSSVINALLIIVDSIICGLTIVPQHFLDLRSRQRALKTA